MDYLNFFYAITKVKQIVRTGWKREGVGNPESVGDHSYGITILAMIFADRLTILVDKGKLMKMALIHDMGELGYGDSVVDRGQKLVQQQQMTEKHEREKRHIKQIFDYIGEGEAYATLFDEMLLLETPEAKIVKQLDKLEMAMQAYTYEKEQGKNLEEFFINTKLYIKEPVLKGIFLQLLEERKNKKGHGIDTNMH